MIPLNNFENVFAFLGGGSCSGAAAAAAASAAARICRPPTDFCRRLVCYSLASVAMIPPGFALYVAMSRRRWRSRRMMVDGTGKIRSRMIP